MVVIMVVMWPWPEAILMVVEGWEKVVESMLRTLGLVRIRLSREQSPSFNSLVMSRVFSAQYSHPACSALGTPPLAP